MMNSEYTVTLSSKGQLTLPAEVRRRLQLDIGDKLRLTLRDSTAPPLEHQNVDATDVVGRAGKLRETPALA